MATAMLPRPARGTRNSANGSVTRENVTGRACLAREGSKGSRIWGSSLTGTMIDGRAGIVNSSSTERFTVIATCLTAGMRTLDSQDGL